MTIREQKQILFYLNVLLEISQEWQQPFLDEDIIRMFTKEELTEYINILHPNVYRQEYLENYTKEESLDLIGNHHGLLRGVIEKLKITMTKTPQLNQEEVSEFFWRTRNEVHYLASKPVEEWDAYDRTNYHSLLAKTGTTKVAYFICTEKVISEKAFAVSRNNQTFFDTYEEALEHLDQSPTIGQFKSDTLTIQRIVLLK